MGLALAGFALVIQATAQELEPRAYTNLPVGLNFAAVIYAYSDGGLSTNPSLPIDDAQMEVNTVGVAYVRSIGIGGMSGKVDVIVPYSSLSGSALFNGQVVSRNVSGFLDPKFRISLNFYGAPALNLQEFQKIKPDFVAGASVQVIPPLGDYDPTKVVNLGTNRWSIKPDIGFSKKIQHFTFDMTVAVAFYTDNDNFLGGRRIHEDPLGSTQANLSYDFGKGIWASFGVTYYVGGRSTVDSVRKDNELSNSRVGLTVSLPINRKFSMKFNVSNGISTRAGTNFTAVGVGLQYRWGAGL